MRPGIPRAGGTTWLWTAVAVLGVAAGSTACISGRVLTGYPGYPFATFESPLPADSVFFMLQPAVESEGFPLDYSILDQGFITTRSAELDGRPVFLTLIVEPKDTASRVWVAAYEETVTGALRINPLNEQAWSAVMEVSGRLSESVEGTAPKGPSERGPG